MRSTGGVLGFGSLRPVPDLGAGLGARYELFWSMADRDEELGLAKSPTPRLLVGGQALLEGVLMRTPERAVAVVRRRDGSLVERELAVPRQAATRAGRVLRAPFMLIDALRIGSAALRFSAQIYEEDERRAAPNLSLLLCALWLGGGLTDDVETAAAPGPRRSGEPLAQLEVRSLDFRTAVPLMVSAVVAGTLLFAGPQAAAALVVFALEWLGAAWPSQVLSVTGFWFQLLTVSLQLGFVAAYISVIGRLPEVRRLFMYHGAEHKSVYAFEAGLPLRVENAGRQSRLHPRCGTSLVVGLSLLSIPWYWSLAGSLSWFGLSDWGAHAALLGLKGLTAPALFALSIELQRVIARDASPLRVLRLPGYAFQRLTTRDPQADQLEVALRALRHALPAEPTSGAPSPS